jgi:hypothetical protein
MHYFYKQNFPHNINFAKASLNSYVDFVWTTMIQVGIRSDT